MKTLLKPIMLAVVSGLLLSLILPLTALAAIQLAPELKPEFAADFSATCDPEKDPSCRTQGAIIILHIIAGSLIYLAGPLAVLMIVWGGTSYITSHGAQDKLEGAKKTILWAIGGLLIIMLSYAIVVNLIGLATVSESSPATPTTEETTPETEDLNGPGDFKSGEPPEVPWEQPPIPEQLPPSKIV